MTQEEQEQVMNKEESSQEEQEESSEDTQEEETVAEPVNNSEYKCFNCSKIISEQYIKKKVRCPYCGSKIIFKARTKLNTVNAR